MLGSDDVWRFYRDRRGQWRWRRTASNGEIVGASHQGYAHRFDCEANAQRAGWRK